MFCSNCGSEIQNGSKFCSSCGAPVNKPSFATKFKEINIPKIDTKTIINIIVSAIMLLAMAILPMFNLYTTRESGTLGLLGKSYFLERTTSDAIEDGIVAWSRFAFVFMTITLIAIVVFRFIRKPRLCLIFSGANLWTLLAYNSYVNSAWTAQTAYSDYTGYYVHSYEASLSSGNTVCLICSVVLVFLALSEIIIAKKKRTLNIETTAILNVAVSATMVLAMITLPMFTLDAYKDYYTLGFLGEDGYVERLRDTVVTGSKFAFVIIIVALIAIVAFRLIRKTGLSLLASAVNLTALLTYDSYITSEWAKESYSSNGRMYWLDATPAFGNDICLICSIALVLLAFVDIIKKHKQNQPIEQNQ